MRRGSTFDDRRKQIGTTLENVPKMGGWQWGMVVLLSQIAFILIDILELLQRERERGEG